MSDSGVIAGPAQLIVDSGGERTVALGGLAESLGWDLSAGEGCFTTGRVQAGDLLWREAHRSRLLEDALSLSPDLPGITGALGALERATDATLERLGPQERRTLRWGLFLDEAGWRWGVTLEPERRPWCALERRLAFAVVPAEVAWRAKLVDRRPQAALDERGRNEAGGAKAQDGTVVLREGRLSEGTWFNLALLQGGRWTVPDNVFPGLTLSRLLEVLDAQGAAVERADIDPGALEAADAVLATSAVLGVGMVGAVGTWACAATEQGRAAVEALVDRL